MSALEQAGSDIIEAAKDTTKEAIAAGAAHKQCFQWLMSNFGAKNTRLILADIAFDLGMKEEAKAYLEKFV